MLSVESGDAEAGSKINDASEVRGNERTCMYKYSSISRKYLLEWKAPSNERRSTSLPRCTYHVQATDQYRKVVRLGGTIKLCRRSTILRSRYINFNPVLHCFAVKMSESRSSLERKRRIITTFLQQQLLRVLTVDQIMDYLPTE